VNGVEVIRDAVAADELVGADHGDVGISLIFVDTDPGRGPSLHRHQYDEVFTVLEGRATFLAGADEIEAGAGDVVIVRAGQPHGFRNTGEGRLRMVSVHLSPRFATEWLG
jgi:mannose-6-phosphate isomerase-like protein (cupin superfamily)